MTMIFALIMGIFPGSLQTTHTAWTLETGSTIKTSEYVTPAKPKREKSDFEKAAEELLQRHEEREATISPRKLRELPPSKKDKIFKIIRLLNNEAEDSSSEVLSAEHRYTELGFEKSPAQGRSAMVSIIDKLRISIKGLSVVPTRILETQNTIVLQGNLNGKLVKKLGGVNPGPAINNAQMVYIARVRHDNVVESMVHWGILENLELSEGQDTQKEIRRPIGKPDEIEHARGKKVKITEELMGQLNSAAAISVIGRMLGDKLPKETRRLLLSNTAYEDYVQIYKEIRSFKQQLYGTQLDLEEVFAADEYVVARFNVYAKSSLEKSDSKIKRTRPNSVLLVSKIEAGRAKTIQSYSSSMQLK